MIYATAGVLIVAAIGKDMPAFNNTQFASEAALRATLALTNDDANLTAEASARLYRDSLAQLDKVIGTLMGIADLNCRVQMFTTGFNLLVPLIPAMIMAPMYFDYDIEFGAITQAVMAFTVVFNGATLLIAQFGGISAFAAVTNRAGELQEALIAARSKEVAVESVDKSSAISV